MLCVRVHAYNIMKVHSHLNWEIKFVIDIIGLMHEVLFGWLVCVCVCSRESFVDSYLKLRNK